MTVSVVWGDEESKACLKKGMRQNEGLKNVPFWRKGMWERNVKIIGSNVWGGATSD